MDAPLPTVQALLDLVPRGSAAFAHDVGGWVLVGKVPDSGQPQYRTASINIGHALRAATGELEAIFDVDWSALVLKKKTGAAFADTILIGRAASNDVCIPHASISKLHARVTMSPAGPVIEDAGSSNGTMVNGDAIKSGAVIADGDLVRFGSVVFQCFEPGRLHALLSRL